MATIQQTPRKTVLITGATSGLGLAASEEMAARGWHVLAVGRDRDTCDQAEQAIRALYPAADLVYFTADLAAQREVNQLAETVCDHLDREQRCLDVLINNVATFRTWYTVTEDGLEMQFAVNHLAGFLLSVRLLDRLRQSPAGRILTVSSASHKHIRVDWARAGSARAYWGLIAYKQSKLANLLMTRELNRRLHDSPVKAYAVDPGLIATGIGTKHTGGLVAWFWRRRSRQGLSPYQSACTLIWLSKMPPDWQSDAWYFAHCRPAQPGRNACSEPDARALWAVSARLCGLPDDCLNGGVSG